MYLWNWSSPLHISHYDNERLYFSANVVFKSADRGDSWQVISPDLTRQISYFDMPMQGKIQPRDALDLHRSTSDYGNITTFSESPIRRGLLAVGSDDGLIHVSRNDSGDWGPEKKSRFPREMGMVGPHLCQLGGAGPRGADSPGIVSAFRCCSLTSFLTSA